MLYFVGYDMTVSQH